MKAADNLFVIIFWSQVQAVIPLKREICLLLQAKSPFLFLANGSPPARG